MSLRVGLIINPVAGLGGEAGLGGSDGAQVQEQALALGGRPRTAARAARALEQVRALLTGGVEFVTGGGALGGDLLSELGIEHRIAHIPGARRTTALDTTALATSLEADGVDVILFAGGDGTARDVCAGVGSGTLCLGIPSGVKMHSGVFAVTPDDVAPILDAVAGGQALTTATEVVDIDEAARREGHLGVRLYGHLLVPGTPGMQAGKRSPGASDGDFRGLADAVLRRAAGRLVVVGPGTTTQGIGEALGADLTLLGVDVLRGSDVVARGVSATRLDELTEAQSFIVVVSPIGGQGIVLGRGNQQIGERVLERLDRADLVVVSSPAKLTGFVGRDLRIDAPTAALNAKFAGPVRVLTGAVDEAVLRIRA